MINNNYKEIICLKLEILIVKIIKIKVEIIPFATNYAFLIKFCLTISFTFSTSFLTSFSNLITRVSDVPTTSLISLNSRIKIPNSFYLSFCRFTKCAIINPVIVIINNTT